MPKSQILALEILIKKIILKGLKYINILLCIGDIEPGVFVNLTAIKTYLYAKGIWMQPLKHFDTAQD